MTSSTYDVYKKCAYDRHLPSKSLLPRRMNH